MVAANDRTALGFCLSAGNRHDAPQGRRLLSLLGQARDGLFLAMDRAYEGNKTRSLASSLGYMPVVPPKRNRLDPWEYDKAIYRRRNEVERLFRRLQGFRRVFVRYDKLDVVFLNFVIFALIIESLRLC
jgi:transposase